MSVGLVTGLLFAAISINMIVVECSIKTAEAGTPKSENIMSLQGRIIESIWDSFNTFIDVIHPGTNWCGIGKITNNDGFGTSEQTDRCCKERHDCKTFITAGGTKYDLTNAYNFTVSDCDCDQKLRDCLFGVATSEDAPAADKNSAKDFGSFFFNFIGPNCLKQDYPIVCVKRGSRGNCTKYKKDTNQAKVWQLVKGLTFPSL